MIDWKGELAENRGKFREGGFEESPLDAVIRMVIGSVYLPEEGEVIGYVLRNHRSPYFVKTVKEGLDVYADPGDVRGIKEGSFVGLKMFGGQTENRTAIITRAYR